MKNPGLYKELIEVFDPELAKSYPSMTENFASESYPEKEAILSYLKSGSLDAIAGSCSIDVFTGESTGIPGSVRSDGTYSWGGDLAYYVDKYNLRLPDEFVNHVLSKTRKAA